MQHQSHVFFKRSNSSLSSVSFTNTRRKKSQWKDVSNLKAAFMGILREWLPSDCAEETQQWRLKGKEKGGQRSSDFQVSSSLAVDMWHSLRASYFYSYGLKTLWCLILSTHCLLTQGILNQETFSLILLLKRHLILNHFRSTTSYICEISFSFISQQIKHLLM